MFTDKVTNRPVAIIQKGDNSGKIIYVSDDANYGYNYDTSEDEGSDSDDNKNEENTDDAKDVKSEPKRRSPGKAKKTKKTKKSSKLRPKNDTYSYWDSVKLQVPGHFLPLPSTGERKCYSAFGSSGSGKTYITGKCVSMHKKALYPDHEIYVFSEVDSDDVLDKLGPSRVKIDESWIDTPPDPKALTDCVCIFDDIDAIRSKKIKEAVISFRKALLNMGRHQKCFVYSTNHELKGKGDTIDLSRESHGIFLFPGHNLYNKMYRFLTETIGLSKESAQYCLSPDRKSRWIMIYKEAPMYCLTENELFKIS